MTETGTENKTETKHPFEGVEDVEMYSEIRATIETFLKHDSDHATIKNGMGANRYDSKELRSLLLNKRMSFDDAETGYKLLFKYRKQLLDLDGIDYFSIPKPKREDEAETEEKKKTIEIDDIKNVFLDEFGIVFAKFFVNNHFEIHPIESNMFEQLYTIAVFNAIGEAPSEAAIKKAKTLYSAKALVAGKKENVYLRSAHVNDAVFIDLCNEKWQVIKITTENIEILNESPVLFKRFAHMQPLKIDLSATIENFNLLWSHIHINEEVDKKLLTGYVCSLFFSDIARAILVFDGVKGAAKSTSQRFIRNLVDPSSLGLLSLPLDEKDLLIALNQHFLPFFDNVSNINKSQSDVFCRTCYGDGISIREYYTTMDSRIMNIKRALGFNGINLACEEADFLDRSLKITLNPIDEDTRKSEKKLLADFENDKAKITGAILKIIQDMLSIEPTLEFKKLPRMADFASYGEAALQAMGENEGEFIDNYRRRIGELNVETIDANSIGQAITELMKDKKDYSQTATKLLDDLTDCALNLRINTEYNWVKAPNMLSKKIKEIQQNLSLEGIKIEFGNRDADGKKLITIRKTEKQQTVSSGASKKAQQKPKKEEKKQDNSQGKLDMPISKPKESTKIRTDEDVQIAIKDFLSKSKSESFNTIDISGMINEKQERVDAIIQQMKQKNEVRETSSGMWGLM